MIEWSVHPSTLLGLMLLYGAYLLLAFPLRKRFHSADQIWAEPVETREVVYFSLAVLTLAAAELSPLHDLSEQYSFSAHMAQHLLLTMILPPLLLLGTPAWMVRPLLRNPRVLQFARWLTRPVVAIVLFNGMLALWHLPLMYELALANHLVHLAQHFFFISSAILLWWPIFSPVRELPRLGYPAQMLYLFIQSLVPAIIASFITFSNQLIYHWYESAPRIWDVSPIADQQLGGLMMKLAGGIALWVPATIIFFIWFNHEEREVEKSWE